MDLRYLFIQRLLILVVLAMPLSVPAQKSSKESVTNTTSAMAAAPIAINRTEASQVISLEKLIQGRISGVQVVSSDGAPLGALSTIIRGVNSVRGNSEPLWILDGVILNPSKEEVENPLWNEGVYQTVMSSLASINPNDIESITVLKNISATAIYGSMGGNGAVVIKTKLGDAKGLNIAWNSNIGISTRTKTVDMLDTKEYQNYIGVLTGDVPTIQSPMDWQQKAFKTGISSNHNLSVSGIEGKASFYISGNLRTVNGVLEGSEATLASLRINYKQQATKFLNVGFNVMLHYNKTNMTKGAGMLGESGNNSLITTSIPALAVNGKKTENYNSYSNDYDDFADEYRVIPSIFFNFRFTDYLSMENTVGVDYRNKTRYLWLGNQTHLGGQNNGIAGYSYRAKIRYNGSSMLVYNLSRKGHNLTLKGGIEMNGYRNKTNTITGYDFYSPTLRSKGLNFGNRRSPLHMFTTQDYMFSPMATLSYQYKDTYFVQASLRADNTPKYDGDSYNLFPSVELGHNLKNDAIFKDIAWLSTLNIIAGWGKAGTQTIEPYEMFGNYFSSLNGQHPVFYYPEGSTIGSGINSGANIYHNTFWRTTSKEVNISINFGVLNNRITGSVGYYNRNTDDILKMVSFGKENSSAPKNAYWENGPMKSIFERRDKMRNDGWEFNINSSIIDNKEFKWNAGVYGAFNRNRMREVGESYGQAIARNTPANINLSGRAASSLYGLSSLGVVNADNIARAPKYYGNAPALGDPLFADTDGSGNIDELDRGVIGNPHPKFVGSLNSTLKYRGFTLDIMFNGVYGNDILNLNRMVEENVSGTGNIRRNALDKAYSPKNTNTSYPAVGAQGTDQISSRFVEDGSYLKLSTLVLSYNIPIAKVKWIKSLGVNFTANNLFTITDYDGWDPDVFSFSNDVSRLGVDYGSYPSSRTFIIGVSATF